jgi:hypothetical protein
MLSCLDTVVGLVTYYGSIPVIFLFQSVQTGSRAHKTSCSMGTACSFVGVKRPGREANHLRSTDIKNGRTYTPVPHMNSWHAQRYLYIFMLRTLSGPGRLCGVEWMDIWWIMSLEKCAAHHVRLEWKIGHIWLWGKDLGGGWSCLKALFPYSFAEGEENTRFELHSSWVLVSCVAAAVIRAVHDRFLSWHA